MLICFISHHPSSSHTHKPLPLPHHNKTLSSFAPCHFALVHPILTYCTSCPSTLTPSPLPPVQILSKDSVPVHVDAVVYYRVDNPIISITNVVDVGRASRLLAQTQLQSILGGRTLAEILSSRDSIQQQLQVNVTHVAS